jgi:hypothetical protein
MTGGQLSPGYAGAEASGNFHHLAGLRLSSDEAAVRISEDPAAGNAQEPLQSACAGSALEPIHGTPQAVMQ